MDLSSLQNLAAYRMSLADYLGNDKQNSYLSSVADLLVGKAQAQATAHDAAAQNSNVSITLSEEAQALLAQGSTDSAGNSTVTGVQKTAQNFMLSFFDQAGVSMGELSDEALDLIQGLQDVISGTGATQRDITTDSMEAKYSNGDKKVYTIVGDNTRLRLAIQYADGKPQKLTITDITGAEVETAEITLTNGEDGKPATINIDRTQRAYQNGYMVKINDIAQLDVKLYGTTQTEDLETDIS